MKLFRSVALCAAILALSLQAGTAAARETLHRHVSLGAGIAQDAGKVVVNFVVPASAAASAGLRKGDILAAVDATPITNVQQFLALIHSETGGTTIAIAIVRDNVAQTLHAVLNAVPDEHDEGLKTTYESVTVDGTLRRTLITTPANAHGRLPALLLIGGIGCFSVDTAGAVGDAYMRVTHDIARTGFVTMRLEKSGVGDSDGPPCHDVDFTSESRSYGVALEALSKDPRVDPNQVYLLGHSIGSVTAPRLALTHHVAGVIVAEAVARNWFEYELINLRRQLVLGGDPPDIVDERMQSKERCMHRLLVEHQPEAQIERDEPDCKTHNAIYPVTDAYVQQVAALNIIEPWTKLSVPALAIYGTSDYVVDRNDHERIAAVVNAAHPGSGTFQPIAALDHLLLVAATPEVALNDATKGVTEPYNSAFSSVVVGWLCTHAHCSAGAR